MPRSRDPHHDAAETLRSRIALSLALDDAVAAELASGAATLTARGDHDGARPLVEAARRHRVGAIKHRALMSAKGIDV